MQDFATSGFVNIVGGCCGTTPDHIAAIVREVEGLAARPLPAGSWVGAERRPSPEPRAREPSTFTTFSGLEPLTIRPDSNFQMIGERTNVTGSAKFARLIKADNYTDGRAASPPSRSAAAPTSSTSTWTKACSTPSRR